MRTSTTRKTLEVAFIIGNTTPQITSSEMFDRLRGRQFNAAESVFQCAL